MNLLSGQYKPPVNRPVPPHRIAVVGVGSGGCKIIDYLTASCLEGPAVAGINTDAGVLAVCRANTKLAIGAARTQGFGTGGDAVIGRQAAEDDLDMIRTLFEGVELAFVIVGLGGGTGTGAAPVVLRAAREAGAATLCFATLPFVFEGAQRRERAEQGAMALRDEADALIVVPNERLFEQVKDLSVVESFRVADETLSAGVCAIWKMATHPGFIRLDFADLKKVVRSSGGACTFASGRGYGPDKAVAAAAAVLGSPLIERGELLGRARSVLVSIAGGADLTLKEVGQIMEAITARVGEETCLFMGTVVEENVSDQLGVTVVISEQLRQAAARVAPAPASAPIPAETDSAQAKTRPQTPVTTKSGMAKRADQMNLRFDASNAGRFKDVAPTLLDGENLDIPTFIRHGLVIEK